MARIAGVDLPREKRMEIALTYIYGVGRTRAKETLEATGVSPDLRVKDATEEDLVKLREYIENTFTVSAPRPMRVPVRAPSAPLQVRRRPSKAAKSSVDF